MVVGYPEVTVDLSPLLDSICNQTHGEMEIIVLSDRAAQVIGPAELFSNRMEASGCTLLVTDSQERAFSSLSCCDYFCFPAPESVLEPDFVSTMTGFLEESTEFGAVRCNGIFVDERDMDFIIAPIIDVSRPHEGPIFESLIARETSINICTWMVPRQSMTREIINHFPLNSIHWDWQISLPLAHKNQVGFIDKNLVKLVHHPGGPMKNILTRYEDRNRIEEDFTAACLDTIEGLNAPENEKSTWRKIAKIVSIKNRIKIDKTFRQWSNFVGYRDELSRILEECGGAPGSLDLDICRPSNIEPIRIEDVIGMLTYHYSNLMLLVLMDRLQDDVVSWILRRGFGLYHGVSRGRRFALYGAGGAAWGILPTFLALGFRPEFIWDKSARAGQTLWGIPVTPPRFSAIPEHDRESIEIVVAIGHRAAAEEVRQYLNENGFQRLSHVAESEGLRVYFQNLIAGFSTADICPNSADLKRMSHGE